MRCYCCDKLLDEVEATSKFADSGAYVEMCRECQKHLPKELKIITRTDLERSYEEDQDADINDSYLYDLDNKDEKD